jgi:hypothetical protein
LVLLAEIEDDPTYKQQWIDTATRALMYLERLRRYQYLDEIEPDHWALLATSRILPLLDVQSVEYWLVYGHGVRVAQSMVAAHTQEGLTKHHGCFTYDRRTCPTATRLEGLREFLFGWKASRLLQTSDDQRLLTLSHAAPADFSSSLFFVVTLDNNSTNSGRSSLCP